MWVDKVVHAQRSHPTSNLLETCLAIGYEGLRSAIVIYGKVLPEHVRHPFNVVRREYYSSSE